MVIERKQCAQRMIASKTDWVRCQLAEHGSDTEHDYRGSPMEPRGEKELTIIIAARLAIDCQDASNPSGIALTLANGVYPALQNSMRARKKGTDWVAHHPIAYLFLFKLMDLAGQTNGLPFSDAYGMCKRIAAGEEAVY